MVANLLRLCGLNLGAESELLPAASDNPDGFWEHRGFLQVNDDILGCLGGGWDLPPPLHITPGGQQNLEPARTKALELIGPFDANDAWGWKDPRNSLTFAFWSELLPGLKAVICVRNPLEVATSLRRRGMSSYAFGLQLWKTYNERLLAASSPDDRIITHYAAYFADAAVELRRVCCFLGLSASDDIIDRCREVIKADLRHSGFSFHHLKELDAPTDIIDLYGRLCAEAGHIEPQNGQVVASGNFPIREADVLRRRLRQLGLVASDRKRISKARQRRFRKLQRKIGALREERDALRQMVDAQTNGDGGATRSQSPPSMTRSAYRRLVRRVHNLVMEHVPAEATVAVVSKGDDELIQLPRRQGWHFPQDDRGKFSGYYPACGLAAIAHVEVLRARGAQYLIIPDSSAWWLESYPDFAVHLATRYRPVTQQPEVGCLYCLAAPEGNTSDIAFGEIVAQFRSAFGRDPSVLDWAQDQNLTKNYPDLPIFAPPSTDGLLPYIDKSVDIVVLGSQCDEALSEAHRVAATAVIEFTGGPHQCRSVSWLREVTARPLPTISIIIPVFNHWQHTSACIRALQETLPNDYRGEILLVDDASTDDTPARLAEIGATDGRVRVIRNEANYGFLDTCNRGAEQAEGDLLIFLNNDTVPLPGWLQPLLQTFEQFPDVGAVGGKLLFPDGRLQEAGGIVFRDASAAHFGRGDSDANRLLFNYVREVDYCSGALLATPRAVFRELGGFDTNYRPGYYEDTDYCFRLRASGRQIYYQPESAIVHFEGVTSGTDPSCGMKQYQAVNRERFLERWKSVLETDHPARPTAFDLESWYMLAYRGRK